MSCDAGGFCYALLTFILTMQSVELVHVTPDAEHLITKMARVSNPSNEDNMETAPRLIKYLIKHRHWSPFELADMAIKIHTTRDISAQICRHRSFTFQEFSSRYALMTDAEVPNLRSQDLKNRQNSVNNLDQELVSKYTNKITDLYIQSFSLYREMIEQGIAKECARRILPLSTYTTLYMHGTLRSWITYIALREKNGTQLEHIKLAKDIKFIFAGQLPMIAEALGGPDIEWTI